MRDPGAPVDLVRLLEAADEPELIDREIPEDAEILELGSGSGRITHPLIHSGGALSRSTSIPKCSS